MLTHKLFSVVILITVTSCSTKLNPYRACNSHFDCASYEICDSLHDEHDSTICRYKTQQVAIVNPKTYEEKQSIFKKEEKIQVVPIQGTIEATKPIVKEQSPINKAKEKCLEFGFKAKSEKFAMCVFEVVSREEKENKEKEKLAEEEKKAEYERIDREANARDLREVQRRAVRAQEQAAMAQQEQAKQQDFANSINLITNGIQMMNGTGAYAPPQPPVIVPIYPYRY